jgi:2-keto-4-pentenoate hydratase
MSQDAVQENSPVRASAQWLMNEHAQRRRFAPLSGALRPATISAAYDVQDALVELRTRAWNCGLAGYKIALTTPAMRKFVGYDNSIAGHVCRAVARDHAHRRLRPPRF